jgi:hypothetical protein
MNERQDKPEGNYLIALLAAVLHNQVPPPLPPGLNMERLYKLAVRHSVANMACYALCRLETLPAPENMKPFLLARSRGIAKEARQELEVGLILSALEEKQIKCMPLKGYIIKNLYPQPDMRMMADVDILMEASQLEKAGQIMSSLGYTAEHIGGNHDVYYKRPVMNIELHRALFAKSNTVFHNYFGTGWERARPTVGSSYRYEMSKEDFYIYLLAHMAKHYRGGGTGIRSVMDVWVYTRHYKEQLDWSYINTELEKAGLSDFAQSIKSLAEQWFGETSAREINQDMGAFILANGTYGTSRNAAMNRFLQGKKDHDSFTMAKVKYSLRILFPNLQHMTIQFPMLDKLPFLLPVCWAVRGMRTVLFRRESLKRNLNNISAITESSIAQMKERQL